jgi:putative lipoic acid-binding regulatory protein
LEPRDGQQEAPRKPRRDIPLELGSLGKAPRKLVLGESTSDEDWRKLDEKVHEYPAPRFFTSIGTGDDDFRRSMVTAVESVIGALPEERVVQRYSEKGKYVSVKIGPIMCSSADQVLAIYQAMRADSRMRYFI